MGWPRIGGVEISLHPALIPVIAAALWAGLAPELAVFACVLAGHELAHVLVASAFGLRVRSIELLPFGGVAEVEGLDLADPGTDAVVALAGPLHNLLCLAGGFMLRQAGWLDPGRGAFFLAANAALALGNLLPALPLDGGRAVRAALAVRRGVGPATVWVSRAGLVTAALVLAAALILFLGRGIVAPSLFVFAYFMAVRARPAREVARMRPWRELARRTSGLDPQAVLPVTHLAADGSTLLRELVARFLPRSYHLVWRIDGRGAARGPFDEAAVWEALTRRGAGALAADLGRPPTGMGAAGSAAGVARGRQAAPGAHPGYNRLAGPVPPADGGRRTPPGAEH